MPKTGGNNKKVLSLFLKVLEWDLLLFCFLPLDCELWFDQELPRFDYNLHYTNDTAVSNWRKEGYHWTV